MKRCKATIGIMALLLLLIFSSCAPSTEVEEERTVKIGLHVGLTGAAASSGIPIAYGQFDSTRYINDHGGINGIKVEGVWEDSRSIAAAQITAHRRF